MTFTHQCLKKCLSKDFFNKTCKLNNNTKTNIENLIYSIEKDLTTGELNSLINTLLNKNKEDLLVREDGIIYQITSSENQKNKDYSDISTINLGECEQKLKQYYGISESQSLIILKLDYNVSDIPIPIVEYKIFHPETKEPLDLNICKDTPISLSYPILIEDNEIYKHDPTSPYYTDKCYPYTTEKNTDITLNDRKKEYNNKKYGVCENNCKLANFEIKNGTKKSKCECQVKTIFEAISSIDEIDKEKMLNNFLDFRSTSNIDVILCPKTLFCSEGIIFNLGFYILLGNIITHIICGIIFYLKEYIKLRQLIDSILKIKKREINKNKQEGNFNGNNKDVEKNSNNNSNNNILCWGTNKKDKKLTNGQDEKIINFQNTNIPPKNHSRSFERAKSNSIINSNLSKINSNSYILNSNNLNLENNKDQNNIIQNDITFNNSKNNLKINKIINNNRIMNYTDNEINSLPYEEALLLDKRTFFQYYLSLIKSKHLIIFTFLTKNDYNSRSCKVSLFYFSFSLLLTVNSLFFQESTIHKMYEDNGLFNFIYQLPKIIYSTIISAVLNIIAKTLSLAENNIIKMKEDKKIDNSLQKCIFLKIKLFFIIIFIVLVSFWYYISCFCAVFKNSQITLLKNCLISFGLSLVYPFGINLIPGLFRIPSLKSENKSKSHLYCISKIIQLI